MFMSLNQKISMVCCAIAINLLMPFSSYAQEANSSASPTNSNLMAALENLKSDAANAGSELLNTLIPKVTRYAKDAGYAAICNEAMVRKNHDDMKQVITFVHQQSRDLIEIIKTSLVDSNVAETILAVQANEQEAIKNKLLGLGNREKIRSSIILTIVPLKKLISSLRGCEQDTLQFPKEILLKLDELETQLDAISKHLLSPNWVIPADHGSTLQELTEGIKGNMKVLLKEAVSLQIINIDLHKMAITYLSSKTENDLERLKQELDTLEEDN